MKTIYKLTATAFGAGYSPFAPGTMGAIVGCLALWLFEKYNLISTTSTPLLFIGLIVIVTVMGIIATDKLEDEWGKDPSKVVLDEVIGMWITMMFVPLSFLNILIGFGLFRFFDIAKPLGIRKLEQLKGGVGVMADDILAGIYANIVLQIIIYGINSYFL
ncbi:MAG: phosphatidylglycerophosphatase A [Flavobacteriales bacterium]|nr:phosphatidylglycerophosphatase A [Flavobacteriales bacterium]